MSTQPSGDPADDWRRYSENLDDEEGDGHKDGVATLIETQEEADAINLEAAGEPVPQTTALIKVNPGADSDVVKLQQEVMALLDEANGLIITDASQLRATTNSLSMLKSLKDSLEELRMSYTQPINGHLKDVNATFRTITDPLGDADKMTRGKVVAFRNAEEAKRKEQERIQALRDEAARSEMALTGELSEPVGNVEVQPALHNRSMTDMGAAGMRSNWKWEVADIKLVPPEHLMVDASRVTRLVKAGLHEIPGLRIWDEKGLSVLVNKG